MSIPELDLNFHSYCSINIATASDTTAAEFNPFADGSYGSGATKNIVKTPDIVYDSTAGSLSFGASGTYFIVFACPLISGSTDNAIVLTIKHNGTDVVVSDDLRHRSSMSPKSGIVNCMLTVQAGDNITVTVDGTHVNCQTGAGTHVTVVKANGHFAGAFYTANANQTTASGPYPIFDTANEGGTVVSNTNGITYSDTNGHFTASANRRFLLFSSWILEGNSAIVAAHSFMRDPGSGAVVVDSLGLGIKGTVDPICHTYHMVKSIEEDDIVTDTFSQTGTARPFTIDKGTGFCMLDISNDGTNPSAHLSLSLNVDSDAFSTTSGDIDIFDAGNTSSGFGTSNHTSTAGVTYESSDGTFTIAQSGDYLVILTVAFDDTTTANTLTLKVNVDSATYYSVGYETLQTCDPVSYPICLVMSLEAGAVLNFFVNNAGAKINDGSSVSIVRLDDVGGSKDLFAESTPVVEIADDFTINSFNKDTSDRQYGRLVEQVPMKLGVRGPVSLRGRRVASTTAPSTEKGNKD